jgi:dTDP-4-dehydrorhamnose reductase
MEIWGGLECTINRVGDDYFDQLLYSGYYDRSDDLRHICDLGITKIRYPLLWEKYAPVKGVPIDWRLAEQDLYYLNRRQVDVIAGLVHHGSGPNYVNIDNDSFSEGLAAYALKVATKFPWIKYYTPVNEPLTTARFCGLYGLWYPHAADTRDFLKILVHECKATIMAMNAIRTVNADAQLVFTEDLGYTHSTIDLQDQADYENHRRWLSIDLICGKVIPAHPLWEHMIGQGISISDLEYFIKHPMKPDILGFNYYITSERFIDTRLDLYPVDNHGGNGCLAYADTEAIRSNTSILGAEQLLREAWQRYDIPMAITEAHINCGREDQLRWLQLCWDTATILKNDNIDIRGVTAWAMFGAHGWNKLLTGPPGEYESGVFELRSGKLRPTALANMVNGFAKSQPFTHPLLKAPGWWEKTSSPFPIQPLMLITCDLLLINTFTKICLARGIYGITIPVEELSNMNYNKLKQVIIRNDPWGIINEVDMHIYDDPERNIPPETLGLNVAILCNNEDIKLLTFSKIFKRDETINYYFSKDDDLTCNNLYWMVKSKFDEQLLILNSNTLVIRPALFINAINSELIHTDNFNLETPNESTLHKCIDYMIDDEYGIWYINNEGLYTWPDLTREIMLYQN